MITVSVELKVNFEASSSIVRIFIFVKIVKLNWQHIVVFTPSVIYLLDLCWVNMFYYSFMYQKILQMYVHLSSYF